MISLLSKLTKSDVVTEPFPHIVTRDVLEPNYLRRLIDEFPAIETFPGFTKQNNTRLTFPISRAMESDAVSPLWKEFMANNSNHDQLMHFARIFGDHFTAYHPRAENLIRRARDLKVGTKNLDTFDSHHLLASSAIDANTPALDAVSSVRGPHIDSTKKIWFALFYLRDENESQGGDLELYKLKDGCSLKENIFNGTYIKQESVDLVRTVKYEANTLFIGVNGPYSIHGVSRRELTPHPRKFFSFNCDLPERLF